jgi:hypothetical protein
MNSTPKEDPVATKRIVGAAQNRSQLVIGCVTVFLLMLVVGFCGFGGWGVYQQFRVRSFLPVQGEVTHSEVGVNRDGDGSTFYPDIRFRYTVDGQKYDTGQYRIQVINSSGRSGKQKVVRRYPVGSKVEAWYDPDQPEVAVINKSFSFFPVIFLAIGVIVLGLVIGHWVWRIKGGGRGSMSSLPDPQANETRGHDVRLKPHESGPYTSSFRETVIFCIGWNAIMWTIALVVWFFVEHKDIRWWSWLTLALLLAVGLYMIVKTIMMSMARVKLAEPALTASAQPLRPNESFEVHYRQRAKQPVYVDRITVGLVCRKSDTYYTGGENRTHTDSEDVYKAEHEIAHDLQVDSYHPIDVALKLQIPENGRDTCHAMRNRIDWLLEVRIAAANWPDYTETFELKVQSEPPTG